MAEHLNRWMEKTRNQAGVPDDPGFGVAVQRAEEIAMFANFTGTVCQFFGEGFTIERAAQTVTEFSDRRSIERLAVARQAMSISIARANIFIADFRDAWNLA